VLPLIAQDILLRGGVRIATEQESQRRVPFLRQLDDRLSCLFGVTRLLAVVVPLKSCGSSNRRIVFRMTFAKLGGTAREVCAKATGFNAMDVTDEAAAANAVMAAIDVFGSLDVVINNAGYGNLSSVEDTPPSEFRAQIETNFWNDHCDEGSS
jgi:Enoyl-(Acyl carrier protein) reductase